MADIQIGVLQSVTLKDENGQEFNLSFRPTRLIGSGSFGVVYEAKLNPSGETVAIKKVLQDRRYKNRELQIMQSLSHSNVVRLLYHFFSSAGPRSDELYLNIVMDYYPETVYSVTKSYARIRNSMPIQLVRLFSFQLFKALAYTHSQSNTCHRDVKPQNLLVCPTTGKLALCDFGSAKNLKANAPNVSYICSRYYRAPELVFGSAFYTTAIDIWSAGCVIAEMVLGTPIFPGDTGVDQLVEIIKVLGTPTREEIFAMNRTYTDYRFPQIKSLRWEKVFRSGTSSQVLDLISKLLVYTPSQRLTAADALAHPFFDELYTNPFTPSNDPIDNDILMLTDQELDGYGASSEAKNICLQRVRNHTGSQSQQQGDSIEEEAN